MSWSTKKYFGFLAGAALAGSVLVGCAGNAELPINTGTPIIPAAGGGVEQAFGTANSDVASQPFPQQVQVTVGGTTQTASLPSNTPLTAGQSVTVFGSDTPIFVGLSNPASAAPGRQGGGNILIYMYGHTDVVHDTGVHITRDGRLSGRVCCPDGHFTVFVPGPMFIARGGNRLDIQEGFDLNFWVRLGIASLPVAMDGELPANGGSTVPLRLFSDLPSVYGGGDARLQVFHANGSLQQTHAVASDGTVEFHDFQMTGASSIPRVGIDSFTFTYDEVLQ
jgi:hypothetical protein